MVDLPLTDMEALKRQNTAWRLLKIVVRRIPLERRDVPTGYHGMIDGITRAFARTQ